MADIVIRRCSMRVVRRGGWSWGREPRQLVDDVVRALPALLAAELQHLLSGELTGEIAAPIRVDLRASLRELRKWARSMADAADAAAGTHADAAEVAFDADRHEIAEALRRSLAGTRIAERIAAAPPITVQPECAAPLPPASSQRATAILALLLAWRSAHSLESLLRVLPDATVEAWHRVLFAGRVAAELTRTEDVDAEVVRLLAAFARQTPHASRIDGMRLRLLAAASLAADTGASVTQTAVRAAIEANIVLGADHEAALPVAPTHSATATSPRAALGYRTHVASVLPFLLLGPLQRIGWIDVLDATMAGARLSHRLPALALALATKVLAEPERGWRRKPEAIHAAATFAGDAQQRPDEEVAALASAAAGIVPALDAAIRRSLLDGRRAGDPLLVCAVAGVRLVIDPPGAFLLAHAEDDDALVAYSIEGCSPVFVPENDADMPMLRALDAAGVTFVTPARPARGEHWTPVRHSRAPRLYSNKPLAWFPPPPREAAERARETWDTFAHRPLPGRPTNPSLDRALSLAAAMALATLAWELWRSREPTDSLLALERFGDLDATVHFDADQVKVRLPLGKRFRHLTEARLLDDVPRVPWLGYRSVAFTGG